MAHFAPNKSVRWDIPSAGYTAAHPTTYAFRACDSLCYRKISIRETENGKPKDKNNACDGRKCSARAFYLSYTRPFDNIKQGQKEENSDSYASKACSAKCLQR